MKRQISRILTVFLAVILLAVQCACSGGDAPSASTEIESEDMVMSAVPELKGDVAEAVASGEKVEKNDKAALDYSNTADGYVMVCYTGSSDKVKVRVTGPTGVEYTYDLSLTGDYDVLPLSDGNGRYAVGVFENIADNRYSTAFHFELEVTLKDEFEPFLRPNKYVDFTPDGLTAKKAAELTSDCPTTLDKIKAVYEYTIENVSYDYDEAASVQSGYIPNVDEVLTSGKGICFDYAALMTAMLRSVGIPTKLVVGYTGSLYHAWINTYTSETGWVEASIYFDGTRWKLMDPTFAANANGDAAIEKYIGNGANYTAKYLY